MKPPKSWITIETDSEEILLSKFEGKKFRQLPNMKTNKNALGLQEKIAKEI